MKPALLVIDMQERFVMEASAAMKQSWEDAIASINQIIRLFRQKGFPVIGVEHTDADHAAAALAAMDRLTSATQGPERALAHREFHGALISACPNRRLLAVCASLFESSELHRHWSAAALRRPAHKGGRHQDVEHRAILAAVVARDTDLAVELHLRHLQRTVELALAYIAFREAETEQVAGVGRRNRRSTA